jgi:hypothetical protein
MGSRSPWCTTRPTEWRQPRPRPRGGPPLDLLRDQKPRRNPAIRHSSGTVALPCPCPWPSQAIQVLGVSSPRLPEVRRARAFWSNIAASSPPTGSFGDWSRLQLAKSRSRRASIVVAAHLTGQREPASRSISTSYGMWRRPRRSPPATARRRPATPRRWTRLHLLAHRQAARGSTAEAPSRPTPGARCVPGKHKPISVLALNGFRGLTHGGGPVWWPSCAYGLCSQRRVPCWRRTPVPL